MITREFNLNLHAGHSIPLVINVSQYDRGEQWVFTLLNSDGTQYSPNAAAIAGTKSDGNLIVNAATVDSDGRVVVSETEQMTAAAGKAKFELLLDDQTHGTANFVVLVEASPADEGVPSASDLSLIQQAIDGTSPTAIAAGVSAWMSEHLTPTTPVVDASLTVQGAAADAKKTGDELNDLKSEIAQGSGLTEDVKQALLAMFRKCMMFDGGDVAYDDLESALYPPANLVSITAVYTQSGTVYDTASLDDLKTDLVVTANMSDGTSETVTTYTLSGTLTEGTSTITVAYGGKTATFNVTVTHFDGIHIDVDVSKIILKKSNSGIAPTYCSTTANNRMSYPDFDLLIEGGKSYKFTVTSTVNTAQVGIQAFNQIALNAANNGNNFNATANTGEVWDSGWQSLESIVSIPASQNSSPIVGVRLAFRQSTSNPTISSNFVTAMTIEEVTE